VKKKKEKFKSKFDMAENEMLVKICKRIRDDGDLWDEDLIFPVEQSHFFQVMILAHQYCPMNLNSLLKASDLDFANDITGIRGNINHGTRGFDDWFKPKFAITH